MPPGVYPHPTVPLSERFWAKVDRRGPDECWLWLAYRNRGGYGWMHPGLLAHRVSFELAHEAIPAGTVLDHICRNTSCVNPAHLEAVPQVVNVQRGQVVALREQLRPRRVEPKTHCVNGHPYDEANTYRSRTTGRPKCRTCHRLRERARVERQRTAA